LEEGKQRLTEPPNSTTHSTYIRWLMICCGVTFGSYFAGNMRLPVVPLYARSLDIDMTRIGLINAGFYLTAGFLSLPMGAVSDRIGRKQLAAFGLALFVAASLLLCWSRTFYHLAGIYILFGLGTAAFGPTMMSFVADISPSSHLGRSYGWYMLALYSGLSLGPALGGFIAQPWGFMAVFISATVLITLNLVLFLVAFPATPRVKQPVSQKQKRIDEIKTLLRNRPLLACWVSALGGCFGLGMFITFIPLHAQNQGLTAAQIGIIFFAQGLANAVSRIPFGHLSDRVSGRTNLVIIGLLGYGASLAGFGISTTIVDFTLYAVILGLSMSLAFTSIGALIAEVVPRQARGLAMGGYNTCIYMGFMISSAVMGRVIEMQGFRIGFFIPAALTLVSIVIVYMGLRGYQKPSNAE
jgi:MFS family permease